MITKDFILENKDKWEEYKEEINELDSETLRYLIIEEPDIISIIDLDKLYAWHIPWILGHHPDLIKEFKPYLDKLDGGELSYVLMDQPGLIKDLKPYLNKMRRHDISYILDYQPGLIKDLKPYLYKLNKRHVSRILKKKPEFSLLFKYLNTKYQDAAYYYTYPSEIFKLDEEEKQELSKKMVELIKEEKMTSQ